VARRMLGGADLGALHGFNPPLTLRDRRGKYCHWAATVSPNPNAPFAELVRLSRTSIAEEMREEHRRRVLGDRPGRREAASGQGIFERR